LEVLENALLNYGLDHHFILIKDIVKDRKRVVDSVRGRVDNADFRKQSFNFLKRLWIRWLIKPMVLSRVLIKDIGNWMISM
jgi:hypothetical protein